MFKRHSKTLRTLHYKIYDKPIDVELYDQLKLCPYLELLQLNDLTVNSVEMIFKLRTIKRLVFTLHDGKFKRFQVHTDYSQLRQLYLSGIVLCGVDAKLIIKK